MAKSNLVTICGLYLNNTANPSTISKVERSTERNNAAGFKASKNGAISTEKTVKYSSNLICVPTGSLILIRPEKIKSPPTKYLEIINSFRNNGLPLVVFNLLHAEQFHENNIRHRTHPHVAPSFTVIVILIH